MALRSSCIHRAGRNHWAGYCVCGIDLHWHQTDAPARRDQVFGDPDRTKVVLGFMWGISTITCLVLLFVGFCPRCISTAANELCQVAKVEEAMSPITAVLPVGSRYMKSTILVVRNGAQIDQLFESFPQNIFSPVEEINVKKVLVQTRSLMALLSNPT